MTDVCRSAPDSTSGRSYTQTLSCASDVRYMLYKFFRRHDEVRDRSNGSDCTTHPWTNPEHGLKWGSNTEGLLEDYTGCEKEQRGIVTKYICEWDLRITDTLMC